MTGTSREAATMASQVEKLVDTLYASVADDNPWISFLQELERTLPCHHATMVLRRPREGDAGVLIAGSENDPALTALQQEHYRNSPFLELPEGKTCVLKQDELRTRHPDYYRYIRHFSLTTDLIGVNLVEPRTGMTFRLRAARIDGEPGFGEEDTSLLDALIPRLRIAAAIGARIAYQEFSLHMLDETSGQVAIGAMVLDDSARIVIKNRLVQRMLLARDGFHVREGILHCNDPRDDRAFRSLLRRFRTDSPHTPEETTLNVNRGSDRSWSLLLKPSALRPGLDENVVSAVIVLVRDANPRTHVTEGALRERLELTRAEAALAARIVNGQSLTDAAGSLGISRCTARAQLASIFARTGVHRQAHLVSHVMKVLGSDWQ